MRLEKKTPGLHKVNVQPKKETVQDQPQTIVRDHIRMSEHKPGTVKVVHYKQ